MENKINIIRSIDDLKKAYKLYYKKRGLRSKIVSFILLMVGLNFAYQAFKGNNPADKFLLAYLMIIIAAVPIWLRFNAAKKALKNNPRVLYGETLLITDTKLVSEMEGFSTTIDWSAFADAIVTDDMVLLFNNRSSFIPYPKRFFSEEEFLFLKEKAKECKQNNSKTLARRRMN